MVPENLRFTKEHEWVKVEGEIATMGITHFAAGELGDVVFVELPKIGENIAQFATIGTIEAVKAVSDIFSPVSGEVVDVNSAIAATPDIVNRDPYGEGWMMKVKLSNAAELDALLSTAEYKELIGE